MTTVTRPAQRNFSAEAKVLKLYENWMTDPALADFYGHSGFCNYGYTTPETRTAQEASTKLVEMLLDFIPEKQGNILDVACGLGATTRQLMNHWRPEEITAINISDDQLAEAAKRAPGARYLNMDAAQMEFPDNSFDNVICVEAAFHFQTREAFFRETNRILRPGGRLVIADILGWQSKDTQANKLKDPAAYDDLLARCGFQERQVVDTTKECIKAYAHRLTHWPAQARREGLIGRRKAFQMWWVTRAYAAFMHHGHKYYVLATGTKPA